MTKYNELLVYVKSGRRSLFLWCCVHINENNSNKRKNTAKNEKSIFHRRQDDYNNDTKDDDTNDDYTNNDYTNNDDTTTRTPQQGRDDGDNDYDETRVRL